MKVRLCILLVIFIFTNRATAQDCKLQIGTNLSGISDWMTEMPFVDMMHNARTWGTRNRDWIGGSAQNHWNTELIDLIEKDENGYPLELPFYRDGLALEDSQMVFTVWAYIAAWTPGVYTFLYDGEGDFDFRSDGKVLKREPGRAEVEIIPSSYSFLELVVTRSVKGNHLRNFRLLMPGQESTYLNQPFNPMYLQRLSNFKAIRFMDWGKTNNWGVDNFWENFDEPSDTSLVPWSGRSKMRYYTWAHNKGVPYEMMCQLSNALKKDMWVCVPHNASDEYIREMAKLIQQNLDPELKVYVEYSNEIWNWMFGQTHWLKTFFCDGRGMIWPEGVVDRVQRNLDVWNDVFRNERNRLVLVAGGQTGWQDVTNRIVLNLDGGSFDALNITGYFGLSEEADSELDQMGASATVSDIVQRVRKNMRENEITYIQNQHALAKKLNVPLVFYEAGQHITPHPFGEEPTYAQALLDLQRDTALYNLYNEWFVLLENELGLNEKALYMNYSFVGGRSARYGSWGLLETLDQDTSKIYAPKFQSITDKIRQCNNMSNSLEHSLNSMHVDVKITSISTKYFRIECNEPMFGINIFDEQGRQIRSFNPMKSKIFEFNLNAPIRSFIMVEVAGNGYRKVLRLVL
jgi:hypothetical protein